MTRVRSQLATFVTGDKVTEDGILLWDREGYPVVSKGGEFRQIVLADGYASLQRSTSSDCNGYRHSPMPLAGMPRHSTDGVTLDPADNTKIMFEEDGKFTCCLLRLNYCQATQATKAYLVLAKN